MTQNRQDLSLYYLGLTDFKHEVLDEFTCKRDLSYYTTLILLTYGDYDQIKVTLELKNIKQVIFLTEEGRNIVNCILKNDFKQVREITQKIFKFLESDAVMSENLELLKRQTQTAFLQVLLKNYTRVNISVVADFMITTEEFCERFLMGEIANGRLNFKIDSDSRCLMKNQSNDLSYLQVFHRATKIIKSRNEKLQSSVLNEIIQTDKGGMGIGGVFSDLLTRNH